MVDTMDAIDQCQAAAEMPRYKSHKQVWALKIAAIEPTYTEVTDTREAVRNGAMIFPAENGYAQFHVDEQYIQKHQPEVGGYYVVYGDGYKSWSPAQAFEEGYTRV